MREPTPATDRFGLVLLVTLCVLLGMVLLVSALQVVT